MTEYVCVHRPKCVHSPHTSIPTGQEEWVVIGERYNMKESHHKDCISGLHYVSRDGQRVSPYFVNENGTFHWLLNNHQGQSVDYATKWGGYRFETVGRNPTSPPTIGSPSKYEFVQEHGQRAYFIDEVTGEYRGTPPTANGAALDSWERDLAAYKAKQDGGDSS